MQKHSGSEERISLFKKEHNLSRSSFLPQWGHGQNLVTCGPNYQAESNQCWFASEAPSPGTDEELWSPEVQGHLILFARKREGQGWQVAISSICYQGDSGTQVIHTNFSLYELRERTGHAQSCHFVNKLRKIQNFLDNTSKFWGEELCLLCALLCPVQW